VEKRISVSKRVQGIWNGLMRSAGDGEQEGRKEKHRDEKEA
jgi:hypothetical protein